MDPRRLLSPEGVEVLTAACLDERDDLALSEELRRQFPLDLVGLALSQRALRDRARGKLVEPSTWLLTRDGLEQATATAVARHRSRRFAGLATVADVCCGIGGDSRELAAVVDRVIGIDTDPVHLALARHNANVTPVRADAEKLPLVGSRTRPAAILVDPARRSNGHRRRGHDESSPPLAVCFGWSEEVARVTIKAAPGLDVAIVPTDWSLEAVAVGRELKELALWSPGWGLPPRRATVVRVDSAGAPLSSDELEASTHRRGLPLPITSVRRFLYDPNPAVTRSGLVQDLGVLLDASMIDERIAFLTADQPLATPFARAFEVLESMPWSLKPVKARLRMLDIGRVEIRQRGLTGGDVDSLRRRLATDGADHAVLVLTRIRDRPWAIVCRETGRTASP